MHIRDKCYYVPRSGDRKVVKVRWHSRALGEVGSKEALEELVSEV
jgi:hypothetical protein